MSEAVVAKRYADALFQLADEKNSAKDLIAELAVVKDVFQTNDQAVQLLLHPQVSNAEKMTFIDEAFGKFGKDVINTLKLLVERQRIGMVIEVIDQVTEHYNEAYGIAEAVVYSVRDLSDDEKENVEVSLKQKLNKKEINIRNVIDPSVLGGIKIRVGNTIYDGTISGKLDQMKHNIGTATN